MAIGRDVHTGTGVPPTRPDKRRCTRRIRNGLLRPLNSTIATSFMQEMHHRRVYLDTGIMPVPKREMRECAEYCGLPYEVRPISLENLRGSIEEALLRLATRKPHNETG